MNEYDQQEIRRLEKSRDGIPSLDIFPMIIQMAWNSFKSFFTGKEYGPK